MPIVFTGRSGRKNIHVVQTEVAGAMAEPAVVTGALPPDVLSAAELLLQAILDHIYIHSGLH